MFAELFDRHASAIGRFVQRRAGPDAVDDVLSETFVVAFERRAVFDLDRADALPWLYGIATTLLRKHRRLEARAWRSAKPDPTSLVTEHDHDALAAELAIARLQSTIARLPARDRDTLLLYAWTDLGYAGVAVALDIPVGTVRSRLNRVRRILRTAAGRDAAKEVPHGRTDPAPLHP